MVTNEEIEYMEMELGEVETSQRRLIYIKTEQLCPHPDNPRKELGDLSEMAESIKANGILQNLTVVPHIDSTEEYEEILDRTDMSAEFKNYLINTAFDGGYTVLIGHRRLEAAKLAGLTEVPCVVVSMDYKEQIATMLTENVQRVDLSAYEQAQGFRQLTMDLGMSVDTIAKKTGFSTTTVRRRLKLCEYNQDTLKAVSGRQISMSDFEKLDKIEDPRIRDNVLTVIGTYNFNRELEAAMDMEEKRKKQEQWRAVLTEAGMTEIKEKAAEDTKKYTRVAGLYGDDRSRAAIEKYLTEDRELFFCVNRWGYATIVTPKPKDEQEAASQKESKAKQEAAAREEACTGLAEAFERAYRLRYAFVKNYKDMDAKRNLVGILEMAINANNDNGNRVDMTGFCLLAGYGEQELEEMQGCPEAGEIFRRTNSGMYQLVLHFVYAASGDNKRLCAFDKNSWTGKKGEYIGNDQLDVIYDSLKRLGYEMSDEEKALMDGTSPLYYHEGWTPPTEDGDESAEEPPAKTRWEAFNEMTDEELDEELGDMDNRYNEFRQAVRDQETPEDVARVTNHFFCAHEGEDNSFCRSMDNDCEQCITAWLEEPYHV